MATRSSILAWEMSRTEEPGGLQSMGSQRRFGHNSVAKQPPPPWQGRSRLQDSWSLMQCLLSELIHI